ncbi:MAG TPA: hypothetical protein DCP91_02900 [Eggerthellaceae bacterium]|nr:hypothetical protein [Eggerthellaceae bacterium]
MSSRQLVIPADAVTRNMFLSGFDSREGDEYREISGRVLASAKSGSMADFRMFAELGAGMKPTFLDLVVMSGVSAILLDGATRFTLADIARSLGYINPHARGMTRTIGILAASIRRLCCIKVELAAVAGKAGRQWLNAIPLSPIISCAPIGDYHEASTIIEILPPDADRPLSAVPLLMRADDAGQVIGIAQWQLPDFSGRRVSLVQRQMALYLTMRALERLPQRTVLLDTVFRVVGIRFADDGAGQQARHRAIRQLIATLDDMCERGTVIKNYELERVGGRIRAISLQPANAERKSDSRLYERK